VQLIGVDASDSCQPQVVDEMLIQHMKSLRAYSKTKNSVIVFVVEKNMSNISANAYASKVRQFPPFIIHSDEKGSDATAGITLDHNLKEFYVTQMRVALDKRLIKLGTHIVGHKTVDDLATLKRQMSLYSRIVKEPNDIHGVTKETLTAKGGQGQKDDLCIAIQMCVSFSQTIGRDNAYIQYARDTARLLR
jgi:hypothetical protein